MLRDLIQTCPLAMVVFACLFCLGCRKPASEAVVAQSQPESTTTEPVQPATPTVSEAAGPAEPQIDSESVEKPREPKVESENAEEPAKSTGETDAEPPAAEPAEFPRLPPPEGATAMPEPNLVWIDAEQAVVIVDGYVSLREGMLEMFACPVGTKEHESIVAVLSSAQVVHAALLAVGAETGTPAQFNPEFKPPTGTEIDIEVRWQDEDGKWQSSKAQQWITDINTEQPMTHPWVFAGSEFYQDEETGEEFYLAEMGDFICVSNFSTATLDIPVESSQVNEGLLFEANAAKIPPLGTPVRLVLKPNLDEEDE